ncbi:hypothetical protein K474DRAFT_1711577 [Panus rudis PR-1116 ss-1]|nr:hypothetical protein K474DRAFT_1711577 [Panus rudis PR-1116 ss-1]
MYTGPPQTSSGADQPGSTSDLGPTGIQPSNLPSAAQNEAQGRNKSPRKKRQTVPEKIEDVITYIRETQGWTLGQLLYLLFREVDEYGNKVHRDPAHAGFVSRFLQGKSHHSPVSIVELMYSNRDSNPPPRDHERELMFSTVNDHTNIPIAYAKPAISSWAVLLVGSQLLQESNKLTTHELGLRVRATQTTSKNRPSKLQAEDHTVPTTNVVDDEGQDNSNEWEDSSDKSDADSEESDEEDSESDSDSSTGRLGDSSDTGALRRGGKRGATRDAMASWDLIGRFSFKSLGELYQRHAPLTCSLLTTFMGPERKKVAKKRKVVHPGAKMRKARGRYRPKENVCTSVISELIYACNQWVNLLPLCRGITLFSMRAHQSVHRIGTRLAQCTTYSTTQSALAGMAEAKREALKTDQQREKSIVMDNIQQYKKHYEHAIGREDKMIKGTGATAVVLENVPPGATDLKAYQERCAENQRANLTLEDLLADLDWDHLDLMSELHFVQVLVEYVPAFKCYKLAVDSLFTTELKKYQIDPNRHTEVHPLGTNSADEVSALGMKEAIVDFLGQIGISEGQYNDRLQFVHGDGKSYEAMGNVKKYLSPEASGENGNYCSLGLILEVLELWHTKWTELGRLCNGKWGTGNADTVDPSTLGYMAKTMNSRVPSDLKKPDFYPNQRLVEVSVKSHIVRCWEVYHGTQDIVDYFEQRKDNLPTIQQLREAAKTLRARYASTQAYERALLDQDSLHPSETAAPQARGSNATYAQAAPHSVGSESASQDRSMENSPDSEQAFKGDWSLANSVLLIRDGIWFLEVWVFTFAGLGHPHYTSYLLDMYCKIKFELPDATRIALFENWLVNLEGKPGHFLELDLMQEHFNKWLEEMAQHKGKEFSDHWYRNVLSMHVFHFLQLQAKMEEEVQLAPRTKKHTSPHLQNEYRAVLQVLREADLHRHHSGRDRGFHVTDDFTQGTNILRKAKLASFIEKTTYARHNVDGEFEYPGAGAADTTMYFGEAATYHQEKPHFPNLANCR